MSNVKELLLEEEEELTFEEARVLGLSNEEEYEEYKNEAILALNSR